ncbi:MAG: hypothetical protein JWQ02_1358 [Capsulimonas sp.]|jgi:hypothetical protein|nr:hypothetical protein [Capsulimonas sp.]
MTKVRKLRPRHSDRPMALAIVLGALSVLAVSVFYVLAELLIPGSAIRNFVDLVSGNQSPTLTSSTLYMRLLDDIHRQMIFEEPIAYFLGGLVIGRIISRRYSQAQALLAGGVMALILNVIALASLWGNVLVTQHGHLKPGQVDTKLELMQTLLAVLWIGVCVLGVEVGLRWRRSAERRAEAQMTPAASQR